MSFFPCFSERVCVCFLLELFEYFWNLLYIIFLFYVVVVVVVGFVVVVVVVFFIFNIGRFVCELLDSLLLLSSFFLILFFLFFDIFLKG